MTFKALTPMMRYAARLGDQEEFLATERASHKRSEMETMCLVNAFVTIGTASALVVFCEQKLRTVIARG